MNATQKANYLNNLTRGVKLKFDSFDAGYYIGSTLNAKQVCGVWSLPSLTSKLIRTIQPGGYVGTIQSYVERNGQVWWILEGGGYVLHGAGKFDLNTANATSSGAQFQADLNAAKNSDVLAVAGGKLVDAGTNVVTGAADLLSNIGKNLPLYLIGALIALFLVTKIIK